MSIFRFLQRNTQPSLFQQYQDYLNQAMPNISGIFPNNTTTPDDPTNDPVTDPESGVTPQLLKLMGGGDNYSVYNPDPTRTRTQKNYVNPFPFNPDDNLRTPDYGYIEPKKDGILGLLDSAGNYLKNSFFGRGISAVRDMLPVNRRGILENELLGAGVMLDDIGRVVATNYNTPEGIMAGYNAAKITDETFDKRQSRIEKTLKDKYGLTDAEIEDALAGAYTGDVQSSLINRIFTLNQARDLFNRRNKAADAIYQRKLEEKREKDQIGAMAKTQNISRQEAQRQQQAIQRDYRDDRGGDAAAFEGSTSGYDEGNYCFDPNTLIQMADGSEKKIKEIQLGDQTKGGEVTGVFQFKASDEIHDYKGVTVAGSHYVKEDGRFIMVKDSPISVKIDKIPVVYSLDTSGRRIFIKDIEFADYNGDGIAKGFLANAGVDLTGFDKEVLRQVEHRLI